MYEAASFQEKVMLTVAIYKGARRGEIFRLTWEDVDFASNRIRLWTRKREGGSNEFNFLPMSEQLRSFLRLWWEKRPVKDSEHLFLSENPVPGRKNKPLIYNNQMMRRLCTKASVKRFGFHGIRMVIITPPDILIF